MMIFILIKITLKIFSKYIYIRFKMIYFVKTYAYAKKEGNGWKNCPLISNEDAIQNLKDGVNKNMNYRLEDDKECLVFGDKDHCPDEETVNKIYKIICDEFTVNDNDISKSYCYKENVKEYSYHWTIPSLKTDSKSLKNIFNQAHFTFSIRKIYSVSGSGHRET